jgi:hypothetical protein
MPEKTKLEGKFLPIFGLRKPHRNANRDIVFPNVKPGTGETGEEQSSSTKVKKMPQKRIVHRPQSNTPLCPTFTSRVVPRIHEPTQISQETQENL